MGLFDAFKSKKTAVSGVVARFGADFGPGEIYGFVLMLEGDARVFRLLRSEQLSEAPIGLTVAGDHVSFEVDASGEVAFNSFRNEALAGLQARHG